MTREEAAKMIENDIYLHHNYLSGEYRKALKLAMSALEQPEIVRCKECIYASPNGKNGCKVYHFKLYEAHEMNANDFCSRAERRTDDSISD